MGCGGEVMVHSLSPMLKATTARSTWLLLLDRAISPDDSEQFIHSRQNYVHCGNPLPPRSSGMM